MKFKHSKNLSEYPKLFSTKVTVTEGATLSIHKKIVNHKTASPPKANELAAADHAVSPFTSRNTIQPNKPYDESRFNGQEIWDDNVLLKSLLVSIS